MDEEVRCDLVLEGGVGDDVKVRLTPVTEASASSASAPSSPEARALLRLVEEKAELLRENDFLVAELAEAKVALAELKGSSDRSYASPRAEDTSPKVEERAGAGAHASTSGKLAGCLVVSGASSGVGKTTVASCISLALRRAGYLIQPFKVGPDFLDGKHLETFACAGGAASRPCVNLDGWLLGGREECIEAFHCAIRTKYEGETGDEPIVAVIEGCMGLYDGRDGSSELGSTAEIAKWLGAPVVLVLDCSAMSRSAAAQLRGFQLFDKDLNVPATVLNKVFMSGIDSIEVGSASEGEDFGALYMGSPHVQWLEQAIGKSAAILGAIPFWANMEIPERHLGLKYPSECRNFDCLESVSRNLLDPEQLLGIARSARIPGDLESERSERSFPEPIARIGVARDEAFCFYYHDNLLMLQENGAELVFFSPMNDSGLPKHLQAIYIGGGYPENFAAKLEENHRMREEIHAFAKCGGIIYAECGGLMYLSKSLEAAGEEGAQQYNMVGVFPFRTRMTPKANLGYVSVKTRGKNGLFPTEAVIRGQFFHFSEIVEERVIGGFHHSKKPSFGSGSLNQAFSLAMQDSDALSPCSYKEIYEVKLEGLSGDLQKVAKEGYNAKNVLASFVHLHFRSNPNLASHFAGVCSLVDADDLSNAIVRKLGDMHLKAESEVYMNPIYNNLKSASSGGSKNSSSDEGHSLPSGDDATQKSNGVSHQRCISCSNLPNQDFSDAGNVSKALSFNDAVPGKTKSISSERRRKSGLYKGKKGSISYADIEEFTLKSSMSHRPGGSDVSFITIPSELAICSLSPQATEMVCALGLEERLVAVTDLCDYPISIHQGRHVVSQSRLKFHNNSMVFGEGDHSQHGGSRSLGASPSAKQVDSKLSEMRGRKEIPFRLDVTWLSITRPGVVITQGTCKSCSPDSTSVVAEALTQAGLIDKSTKQPVGCSVLDLKAYILSDVFQHLIEIGTTCGVYDTAVQLVTSLRHRLRQVANVVSRAEHKPRVISFEGLSPLVLGGHWLPEMKSLAGGFDPLQEPGALAHRVNWQRVRACAPEILILTPCSSSPLETLSEVNILASMPGWWSIPAVYKGEVYIIDHAYFSRPGPRLVDGIELLAHIFHPNLVKLPSRQEASRDILKFTLKNGQRCNPKQLATHFQPYNLH
ncbi:CobB/CobQ glutamine amidotransferase [Chloropicon primus]|nr:CobB/CobQ glutamine amidotransferase [Chloropicon primus]